MIGLGNMGSAVARNIQRANYPLYVYDINKEAGKNVIDKWWYSYKLPKRSFK